MIDIYEIADMPHQKANGKWIDLETGLEIFPTAKKRRSSKNAPVAAQKANKAYGKDDGKLGTYYKNIIKKNGVSEELRKELSNLRMPVLVAIAEKMKIGPFANKAAALEAICK